MICSACTKLAALAVTGPAAGLVGRESCRGEDRRGQGQNRLPITNWVISKNGKGTASPAGRVKTIRKTTSTRAQAAACTRRRGVCRYAQKAGMRTNSPKYEVSGSTCPVRGSSRGPVAGRRLA
jgi:hypothetical protein